ncbi:MAG: hypothetical protein HKP55_10615 [Gammaproteobacteria bacterium]|nr:hypothetical protein [Gammaproteobacteria bacterium]NNJ92120.1 hypothetical protein [Gammaproteobacteria bacterium]
MSSKATSLSKESEITQTQNLVSIFWPSFLVASLTTILFFAFFDPSELGRISGYPEVSRLAGYTIGFLLFWLFSAVSSALTYYFRQPCHQPVTESE